jgi:hypothetical protein
MDENQTTTEAALTSLLTTELPCPQCDRVFTNEAGLRMHKIRMHSDRNWQTAQNFKGGGKRHMSGRKPSSPDDPVEAERLRKRRVYQRNLRDRYYREGRNSKGELMPAGWKPNRNRQEGAAKRYGKAKKVSYVATLTGKRRDLYLAKQRVYQRKLYHRKREEGKLMQNGVLPVVAQPVGDIHSDAAKAILMAASVIRAVATGLKVEGR